MIWKGNAANKVWLLVALFVMSIPITTYATHIIGGSIRYRCLGNNQYELTVNVYRDCYFGAADAPFDDPASVGVFDASTNALIQDLRIPFVDDDTLNSFLFDPCFVVPPTVCVHRTAYIDTVELQPRPGGYIIAYQRCCRNVTINNIINPVRTGATYWIEITEDALTDCNSSPVFRSWPPIFICAGTTLNYDHSAVDADGDSLVYKLCTPYAGASFGTPKPQPPNNPPYDTVRWNTGGGYNLQNLLGSGVPLRVDLNTGLMTGRPEQVGQFVVGVCIEEYRDGKLLSRTIRDFQYNVGLCGRINAALQAPSVQCDNRTVNFQNLSQNAFDFEWIFDYPNGNLFSDEFEPVFTYPDTGTYTVALVAEPTSACSDTVFQDIFLQDNSLIADFELIAFECVDSTEVLVTDLSFDLVSPVVDWTWEFQLQSGGVLISKDQNPVFRVPSPDTVDVTLTALSENGCVSTLTKRIPLDELDPAAGIRDTLYICEGNSVALNPSGDTTYNYAWNPAIGLDAVDIANPIASPTSTTLYEVFIDAGNSFCRVNKKVLVVVQPDPQLNFEIEPDCDDRTITFTNTSNTNLRDYGWTFEDPTNPNAGAATMDAVYTFPDEGTYTIRLFTGPTSLCQDTLVRDIVVEDRLLQSDFTLEYLNCEPGDLLVQFTNTSNVNGHVISGYRWNFSGNIGTATGPVQQIPFTTSENIQAQLVITTTQGCRDTIEKDFDINLVEQYPDDVRQVCIDDTVGLNPGFNPTYLYQWSPATGLSCTDCPNPLFSNDTSVVYTVEIAAFGADTCEIVRTVNIFVPDSIGLRVSDDEITCDSVTTLRASTAVPNATIRWINDLGQNVGTGRTIRVPVSGIRTYTAIAEDAFACKMDDQVQVAGGPVDAIVSPGDSICKGDPLDVSIANQDPNDDLSISWSPSANIISGANSPNPVVREDAGNYTYFVEAVTQFGCLLRDTVNVLIVDPDMTLDFDYNVGCDGLTVEFNNTSQNGFDFFWNFGDPTDPDASSTVLDPVYTYADTGRYNVLLTIQHAISGCTDSIVKPVRLADKVLEADFEVRYSDCRENAIDVAFTYQAFGLNNITNFLWDFGPFGTSQVRNPVLTINDNSTITATLYVEDNIGCKDSLVRTFDVELTRLTLPDTPLIQCENFEIFLNPNGNPDYLYEWSPANLVSGVHEVNPKYTGTQTGTVTVRILNIGADTCEFVKQVTVEVPQPIVVDITGDSISCGYPFRLFGDNNVPARFRWEDGRGNFLGSGLDILVDPASSEWYYLEGTDNSGCKNRDSILVTNRQVDIRTSGNLAGCENVETLLSVENLDPVDQLTYSWSPVNRIISGAQTASPLVRTDRVGTNIFFVEAENQFGCRDTGVVELDILEFNPGLDDGTEICYGVPTPINPNTNNPDQQYFWLPPDGLSDQESPNPIATLTSGMTYTVIISEMVNDTLTCIDTLDLTVDVRERFQLETSGDSTFCEQQIVEVAVFSPLNDINFVWSDNPTFQPVLGREPNLFVNRKGVNTYYVIGTDDLGCKDTADLTISMVPIEVQVDLDTVICAGEPENVEITNLNPNQNLSFDWNPKAGIIAGANTSSPTIDITETTTFSVTVSNQFGCVETVPVTVSLINLDLIVDASANPDSVLAGESSQLMVTEGNGFSYIWTPSNTLDDNEILDPIATPTETTDYTVEVMDENGCVTTRTVRVTVYDPICIDPFIFLPNAFSPNGDNENDVLYLLGNFVDEMHLVIYNRWGQKVFETRDQSIGWDGTLRGEPLSPDVYGFYLTVRCIDGEEYFKKGNITLIR